MATEEGCLWAGWAPAVMPLLWRPCSTMDPSRMFLVAMVVAVVGATGTQSGQQATPEDTRMESCCRNSSAKLRQTLHSISTAILDSLSSRDHSCPRVCETVLHPVCLNECRRRWLPMLVCRMVCYSSEMMCCRCPIACHRPFQECYTTCAESNTSCKDNCIAKVNKCCSDDRRTAQGNQDFYGE